MDMKKDVTYLILLILAAIALALASCTRTVEKVVEHHTTDTLYQVKIRVDSIYNQDSIFVNTYTKGDTVYITKDRWKTMYKFKIVNDTIHTAHTDTLWRTEPNTKVVEKKKPLPWYQRIFLWLGIMTLSGGVLKVVWYLYKKGIIHR